MIMRQKRDLAENVWYGVETAINSGEPLFRLDWTTVIFCRVLLDAKERFDFEMRGLVLSGRDGLFQRGGFFAAAPWRSIQATPSPVRTRNWAGGDACIQRGGFFAAAPWQGF
jgi:hypothetical protein